MLRSTNNFHWDKSCADSFEAVKKAIANHISLTPKEIGTFYYTLYAELGSGTNVPEFPLNHEIFEIKVLVEPSC